MNEKSMDSFQILIVEDDVTFAKVIASMLKLSVGSTSKALFATTLSEARFQLAKPNDISLILLDLTLPDSADIETLTSVQSSTKAPIIVLTGQPDETYALEALKYGAQDYLLKGEIDHRQLRRSINYAIERHKSQQLTAERIRLYEQREDFIATLTHDLKNPLIGANRILELMAAGTLGKLTEQQVRLLLNLKDSNDALIAMVINLLEVYRFDTNVDKLQKENTDLSNLIESYIETAMPLLKDKNIELVVSCQTFGCVPIEQNAIFRVIQNLVENAIKFTPKNGQIKIRLWLENGNVFFQVADTGPGVPEEERARLFQRFFQGRRGKASTFGTGLGLYLCRQIVQAHNGNIWCEEYEENNGAVFTLTIPTRSDIA